MKREPKFLLISLLAVLTVTSSSVLLSNYSVPPQSHHHLHYHSYLRSFKLQELMWILILLEMEKQPAFDGKNSISSDGNGFCNTVDNIAGGKFASLLVESLIASLQNSSACRLFSNKRSC